VLGQQPVGFTVRLLDDARTSASISSEVASLYGWCWKAGGKPSVLRREQS